MGLRITLTCAALTLSSCTIIAAIEPDECRSHRDCEPLNTDQQPDYHTVTSCERWYCSGQITGETVEGDILDIPLQPGACVFGPLDVDNDSVPGPECEGVISLIDCDDLHAVAFPGGVEACDGLDNDCDGVLDEGGYEPWETAPEFTTPAGPVAWSDGMAIVGSDSPTDLPRGVLLPSDGGFGEERVLAFSHVEADGTPRPTDCLGSGSCGVAEAAIVSRGTEPAVMLGLTLNGCSAGVLRAASVGDESLRVCGTVDDGRVSNVAPRIPETELTCVGASTPSIALDLQRADEALAVWLARDRSNQSCPAAEADVQLIGLQIASGFAARVAETFLQGTDGGVPTTLGRSSLENAPVVAVPGGWLAATAGAGTVRLFFVPQLGGVLTLEAPVEIGSFSASANFLSMASQGNTVGVVWDEGCSGSVLSFLEFDFTAPARPTLPAPVRLEATMGRHPVIASDPEGWLLAYEDGSDVRVTRISDGQLLEAPSVAGTSVGHPALVRRASGRLDLFASSPSRLVQLRASCADLRP